MSADDDPRLASSGAAPTSSTQLLAREAGFAHSDARKQLIRRLESLRESRVLVWIERAPAPDGLLRHLFEHLRATHGRSHERLSLVLYARGAASPAPEAAQEALDRALRVMALLREYARELEVLLPSDARGEPSLLAVGADRVLLHPLATLGELPGAGLLVTAQHYQRWAAEAALEGAGAHLLTEHRATEHGHRLWVHARLRDALRQLLSARVLPRAESTAQPLYEALDEARAPLSRPLDRRRARELLALAGEFPEPETESALWELFCAYEHPMGLVQPTAQSPHAVLETRDACHAAYGPTWRAVRAADLH